MPSPMRLLTVYGSIATQIQISAAEVGLIKHEIAGGEWDLSERLISKAIKIIKRAITLIVIALTG